LVAKQPFVFSTGYHKDRLLEYYRTFPALQKPFHLSELTDMLARLLGPGETSVESKITAVA
jgi:hypothetical protein